MAATKRPVQPRRVQRTAEILDAAMMVLVDEGWAGFSLRRVAASAGVGLAHVQYYFPSKQGLVQAMLERFMQLSVGKVQERMKDAEAGSGARLAAAVDAVLADQGEAARRFFCEVWAAAERDLDVARILDGFYALYRKQVADLLLQEFPHLPRKTALHWSSRMSTTTSRKHSHLPAS